MLCDSVSLYVKRENRPPYKLGMKVKEETELSPLRQPPDPLPRLELDRRLPCPFHPAWLAARSGLPMEQSEAGSLLAGMSGPRRSAPLPARAPASDCTTAWV